jgi:hypothetical protein
VLRKLRRLGYALVPDPHPVCAPQIVAEYINIVFEGPHENIDSHNAVVEAEGNVGCEVDKETYPAAKAKPWRVRIFDDRDLIGDFEVTIANVSCRISPADGKEEEQVQRLADALRALAPGSAKS